MSTAVPIWHTAQRARATASDVTVKGRTLNVPSGSDTYNLSVTLFPAFLRTIIAVIIPEWQQLGAQSLTRQT